ncbi:DNA topoisomerase III [Pancytospora philotis]|nr:DNA topoisomerase III [Pancytospora philotis]
MKILNVAEKPSVAKSISRVLSTQCRTSRGRHKYCTNTHFELVRGGERSEMVFTSVLGHLYEHDFEGPSGWSETDPYALFGMPIRRRLGKDMEQVAENIRALARGCAQVIIWTDCDREGENIAMQIKSLLGGVAARRARFSGISHAEIERALAGLVEINEAEAAAVDARIELDLRIGAAFTRFQTLAYGSAGAAERKVLSFGPCQIPTLNFVVQRHLQIAAFVPEGFYGLENRVAAGGVLNVFKWSRDRLYDRNCVLHFHRLLSGGTAAISDKRVESKEKWRPLPLRTVEFQKACSSYYKMPGHVLMGLAEKLYNNGYISYPRTETDSFSRDFDFKTIVGKLARDSAVGEYAAALRMTAPRRGKNDDQAHSPIYPLKDGAGLAGDERKVYEFVARRFLACISANAKGVETEYTMAVAYRNGGAAPRSEEFWCRGLQIIERNYLDVYIYDKWEATVVSDFAVGDVLANGIEVTAGSTTAPEYLTESDLISLMDKHGIGTDATIHEHIQKIQTRDYARKERLRFVPTQLGVSLIKAYVELDLNVNEPTLRKNLEANLGLVCAGRKDKQQLVAEEIALYRRIYKKMEGGAELLKRILREAGDGRAPGGSRGGGVSASGPAARPSGKKPGAASSLAAPKPAPPEGKENAPAATGVRCNCGQEAKAFETKKKTNSGRQFYCCAYFPKQCDFFQWGDSAAPSEPVKRKDSRADACHDLKCDCGYDPAKKTAHTEGNNGREFYCCNKNYKRCKFFKWIDELQ